MDMRKRGQFYVCQMFGAEFMLVTTMWRHHYAELDGFRQMGAILRAEYEEARKTARRNFLETEHGRRCLVGTANR